MTLNVALILSELITVDLALSAVVPGITRLEDHPDDMDTAQMHVEGRMCFETFHTDEIKTAKLQHVTE